MTDGLFTTRTISLWLANTVLKPVLAATPPEDLDALSALPLFFRFAPRSAQVAVARLKPPHSDDTGILGDARRYFRPCPGADSPPAPRLIAVGGLSGTGKTVLARALAPIVAPQPGAVVLRSDVIRKQMFGVADTERLPPSAYTPELAERVYATLAERARPCAGPGPFGDRRRRVRPVISSGTPSPRWPGIVTCLSPALPGRGSGDPAGPIGGRRVTHPMRRKRLPRCKSAIISAISVGRPSMHPGHKRRRSRAARTRSLRAGKAI